MSGLGKYSFGTGDRFGKEGKAQLKAVLKARENGVEVTPVWNKSHREHETVNSKPHLVWEEADAATESLDYSGKYFVDADHINLDIVDAYLSVSNFFTIDVADYIGKNAAKKEKDEFLKFIAKFQQKVNIPGISTEFEISEATLNQILDTFLFAVKKASEVYLYIKENKSEEFVVEVSMDEVEKPQTPEELFFVLAAFAFYEIPVNTIAPKFTGRFNKGIDYEGDLDKFTQEFEEDLLVLDFAKKEFGLPKDLKLSIHSGSDKFSIYPIMNRLIKKHNAGLHVKTAGTTWLEEINVIAESGEDGFEFALSIYEEALKRFDELTSPYPDVLDIDKSKLPNVTDLKKAGREKMAKALRHDQQEKDFNPHFRQLMHCAYKLAAEKEQTFFKLLEKYRKPIEEAVTHNLYQKHLKQIF
ncbi:tagaturonate epimerase family protein [Salegentibacter sp. JZCK2]|uniref:tagaturonate epimerase family protein n=1 Tax=Salegentibacter tibetensis TaxID=2873600 RepID=UPI001CCD0695|nr:tagaturonate epimerase family protein [Salegentibacter tibetensis]MBZ9730079.1 tagaturonate epimerase family protein [Salegentibacter tibetensis]